MTVVAGSFRGFLILLGGLIFAGCYENTESPLNEQKDPNYLRGKSLEMSENYKGAAEAFEKALEANPRNASADFELFVLNEQNLKDYAAAIYYGERFVRLRPNSEYAGVVRQRITGCKRELAKELPVVLETPAMLRDFERLNNENKLLRQQVETLTQKLALATNRPVWPSQLAETNASNLMAKAPPTSRARPSPEPDRSSARERSVARERSASPGVMAAQIDPPETPKSYTVRSGDTFHKISVRYNVRLSALRAANPGIDDRRLKAGQVIKIPVR